MNKEGHIAQLRAKAEKETKTADDLFNSGHYDWCLFMWHLAIELIIKAKIVAIGKEYPYTHDLVRLVKKVQVPLSDEIINQLYEITTYNIEARYESEKLHLYKKATKEYTTEWVTKCKNIFRLMNQSL